ncbi:hypothetical protein FOY67_03270 [Mycoplasma capricolum subsp. capripneumoniae]|nr:hypothetical protein FOY67_03270 [Mycoplasma capricolum subsp. capripneumoniae]
MKKLLTLLGSVGLIASTSAAVVACGDRSNTEMNHQIWQKKIKIKKKKNQEQIQDQKQLQNQEQIQDQKQLQNQEQIQDQDK